MYRLKQRPEDFRVTELMELEAGKEGKFGYYRLWKRGWDTQSACSRVARAFGKSPKVVNFAGNKDKQAVTEQYISILNGPARGLELEGLRLEYLGRGKERINLGRATGNRFEIVVRGLDREPEPVRAVPNYFDVQRFGKDLNNHLVGKLILQRKFEEAVKVLGLEVAQKGNWLGALRSLPRRTLRLYLHAYQSWLWNQTVLEYLKGFKYRAVEWELGELIFPVEEVENEKVPIVGYGSGGFGKFGKIVERLLEVRKELFQLRSIPEADLKGGERGLMVEVDGLEIGQLERDELNPGKKKCLVRFSLPKGAYGTMVVRILFG